MGFLRAIKFPRAWGRALALERGVEARQHQGLADPLDGGKADLKRLADGVVRPRWPLRPQSALSKMRAWVWVRAGLVPAAMSDSKQVRSSTLSRTTYFLCIVPPGADDHDPVHPG